MPLMRISQLILCFLALGSTWVTAQPPKALNRPDSLVWSDFVWAPVDLGKTRVDKGAILLPTKIPGEETVYYMQLDLGSDVSMFYDIPYSELVERYPVVLSRNTFTGHIAGIAFDHAHFLSREGGTPIKDQQVPVIGTVGLDFIESHVLIIDYPNRRVGMLNNDATSDALSDRIFAFVDAVHRDGKLFVPLKINGKTYENQFFFDTGTSIFPISTTPELWHSFTGHSVDDSRNVVFEVPAWETQVKLIGSRLRGDCEIASVKITHPTVYFQPNAVDDFSKWSFRVSGLFGNALFFDRTVVVDVPHSRFGVSRVSSPR